MNILINILLEYKQRKKNKKIKYISFWLELGDMKNNLNLEFLFTDDLIILFKIWYVLTTLLFLFNLII